MPRKVAYLWSPELQAAADHLPANTGRSSRVHSLIRALELVSPSPSPGSNPSYLPGKAALVPPDKRFASEAELKRYHHPRYVEYLLKNGDVGDPDSDADSDSDAAEDAHAHGNGDGDGARARKRRRIQASGLEYDCPPFPMLAAYARLVAASTLTACNMLAEGEADTAIVWDGGRHHAQRAQASGFCYVADAVLGILYLSRHGVPCERPWGVGRGEEGEEEEEEGEGKVGEEEKAEDTITMGESAPPEPSAKGEVDQLSANGPATDDANGSPNGAVRSPSPSATGPRSQPEPEAAASPEPTPVRRPRIILQRRPRILYLDMDLHYGDGVALAFKSPAHYSYPLTGRPRPPQVLTLSVHHCAPIFFPPGNPGLTAADTPHPFSLAYPLAAFAHSATYARGWRAVERVAEAWCPDYVVLQLGVDGLPQDPVGMYGAWGVEGEGSVPDIVRRVVRWGRPAAVLGGGGYVNDNAARAWALATAAIVGREMSAAMEVPDHAFWSEYAPAYTLEIPESNTPDENTSEALDEADAAFEVLARRIKEIVGLHA